MIRKAASKFFILAAVTLASGAVAVNCSKKADDDVGSVGLALTLPGSGATINTVNYTITGNGITPIMGTIDVSAPGTTTATALVSGLAPGMYNVAMTAMSSDGQNCMGSTPFTVVAGQTAMANVVLQCTRTRTTGSVAIGGRIDQCPFITGVSASRLQAPVGGSINLAVAATDSDGDPITYSWTSSTAGTGALGPNAAATTFTCNAIGTTSISIAVSDGICGDSLMNVIPINCTMGTPGTAGTGGSTGVGGTGGGGTTGTGGGGTGGGGTTGTGGGGTGGGGTGGGGTGGGGTGGTACINTETSPPASLAVSCGTCLMANFSPSTDGCCGITDATGSTLCTAVSVCIRGGSCNNAGDTTNCFCGTNAGTCDQAGAANGPCVAQITAAAGRNISTGTTDSPTAAQVLARFGDPNFALGRIINIEAVAGAFCPAECGF